MRCVAAVSAEHENEEESAQYILALGNPRHRFDVHWMQSKERRGKSAAPFKSRQLAQNQKKQKRVCGMKQDVRQMKTVGVFSKELRIEHERQPRERVPVAGVPGGERPDDIAPLQTAENVRIFRNVKPIVVGDEWEVKRAPIKRERDQREAGANQECAPRRHAPIVNAEH